LKPNYSILYPEETDHYVCPDGMDINEWAEGEIKIEITDISIQKPD